jgi:hypothetical protein
VEKEFPDAHRSYVQHMNVIRDHGDPLQRSLELSWPSKTFSSLLVACNQITRPHVDKNHVKNGIAAFIPMRDRGLGGEMVLDQLGAQIPYARRSVLLIYGQFVLHGLRRWDTKKQRVVLGAFSQQSPFDYHGIPPPCSPQRC